MVNQEQPSSLHPAIELFRRYSNVDLARECIIDSTVRPLANVDVKLTKRNVRVEY